jgi:hypothetical protein
MELARIENLLEKYFEAETTVEEENTLKAYFMRDDVATHLEEYKPIFNYFSLSAEEGSKKSIQLTNKSRNLKWLSIAAMLVFIISVYSLYTRDQAEKREAELAYIETQRALNLISHSLNKGTSAISQLENFNKGTVAMSQMKNFENAQKRVFN